MKEGAGESLEVEAGVKPIKPGDWLYRGVRSALVCGQSNSLFVEKYVVTRVDEQAGEVFASKFDNDWAVTPNPDGECMWVGSMHRDPASALAELAEFSVKQMLAAERLAAGAGAEVGKIKAYAKSLEGRR